jgi:hypothetical protein
LKENGGRRKLHKKGSGQIKENLIKKDVWISEKKRKGEDEKEKF